MKKLLTLLVVAAAMVASISSCKDNDDDVAQYYNLTVNAELPDDLVASDITSANLTVTNNETGEVFGSKEIKTTYTMTVPGGVYSISLSYHVNDGGSLKAYNDKRTVTFYEDITVALKPVLAESGSLIFKEVYYNMVKPNGRTPYMRDQFFELYNNSDEVFYLDNCVLGLLEGTQGVIPTAWREGDEIMKEYALGYYVAAFVGSGTDYPVQPGQSIVIASVAQNHKEETGVTYQATMSDPNIAQTQKDAAMASPVDLSNADFEVCLLDYKPATAVDNPNVPNMSIIYKAGTNNYFMLPYTGNAIILAKLPAGTDPVAYAQDENNLKYRPDGSYTTERFLMIPQEYVLDGINIVNSNESKRTVRLRSEVDAGMVFMSQDYAGKSIRRKVLGQKDGRVVYQDTNNSTEDFLSDQVPAPGVN